MFYLNKRYFAHHGLYTDAQIDRFIRDAYLQGQPASMIAERLGVSGTMILKHLDAMQVSRRPRGGHRPGTGKARTKLWFTLDGQTRSLRQWADAYGLNYQTLYARLKRGMPLRMALRMPLNHPVGGWQRRTKPSSKNATRST